MLPPDARDAALARIHFAPAFIGSVMLERLVDVDMVWRYRLGRCQWARLSGDALAAK